MYRDVPYMESPAKHPLTLHTEAATLPTKRHNMIDLFNLEAYGEHHNCNDVEIFLY